jgi:predicted GIY-YIG superfamily endonuclease
MYYVYELINLMGGIEYVGQTVRPKERFSQHTKKKPGNGCFHGRFYKRQDISMNIVATYATESEARKAEYDLQIFWGLPPEKDTHKGELNHSAKLTEKQVREIKNLLNQKISCSEIGKSFNVHRKIINNIKLKRNWSHVS